MVFEVLGDVRMESMRLRPAYELSSGIGHAVFYSDRYPDTSLLVTSKRQVFWDWRWRDREVTYKGEVSEVELAALRKIYEGDESNEFSESVE